MLSQQFRKRAGNYITWLLNGRWDLYTVVQSNRVRHTINPDARREVLRRLLALNHLRAAAQSAAAPPTTKKTARKKKATAVDLFSEEQPNDE